jgi:hypothetical protein
VGSGGLRVLVGGGVGSVGHGWGLGEGRGETEPSVLF